MLATAAVATLCASTISRAANADWITSAGGNWVDGANWSTDPNVPGATSGTTNTDIATFNTPGGTVVVDAYRNVRGFSFTGGTTSGWTFATGTLHLTSGGQINLVDAGGNVGFSAPIVLDGDGGTYTFTNDSASRVLTFSAGGITGAATGTNITTLTWNGSSTSTSNAISGSIGDGTGGGKLALVKSGAGVLTLSGTNTYTGGTTIREGSVRYTASANLGGSGAITLGDATSTTNVSLLNTAGADGSAYTRTVIVASGNSAQSITYGSAHSGTRNYTYAGSITLGSADSSGRGITLTHGSGFGLGTFSATISNPTNMTAGTAGAVRITGGTDGTVSLSGNNTYTGGLLLASGKLSLNNGNAPGTGTITVEGGNFNQLVGAFTNSRNNAMVWNSDFTSSGNLTADMGAGAVNLGATGTATTRVVTSNNTGSTGSTGFAVRGVISDGTNGTTINLTKSGTGILALGGASNYTGNTSVTNGTLRLISGNNRLPATTVLSLSGQSASGGAFGTFDLNTRSQSVAGLSGGGISGTGTSYGTVTNNDSGTGTATLTVTGTSSFAGTIKNGSTAKVALTKSTGGVLTLAGDSTYTGATNVSGGTLIVNGSITSATTLSGTGTIGGSGTVGAIAAASGTFISPGSSAGKLTTTGNITLGAGSLVIELALTNPTEVPTAGGNYDQLYSSVAASTVNLTGGNLQLSAGAGLENGDVFFIVSNEGTDVTGEFGSLNGVAGTLAEGSQFSVSGYTFKITYAADAGTSQFVGGVGSNDVALQVVPEPTMLSLLGGLTLLAGRRRRIAC